MGQFKVCVYAISKNEEKFVERWMASAREADMVVVLDTGSADGTVSRLRAAGAFVYEEKIEPWRFDTARNKAMAYIPQDADICVSGDLDEVFEPGWREKLANAWEPSYTRARYMFEWGTNPDGEPRRFPMEKIHRRRGFKWVHPVHEVLEYSGPDEDKTLWINGLVLHHHPDPLKPRSQYLPLLELSAKENPEDDRTIFWLGREYMYYKKYDKCIETLLNHLRLPAAKWPEERSASMRFIGASYEALGNSEEAKTWLYRALAECPHTREPYLALARLGYGEGNWPMTYAMVKNGLDITKKTGSYLTEPECWGFALYDLGAISAFRLGLYGESLEFAKKALEFSPKEPRLQKNLLLIETFLNIGKAGAGLNE